MSKGMFNSSKGLEIIKVRQDLRGKRIQSWAVSSSEPWGSYFVVEIWESQKGRNHGDIDTFLYNGLFTTIVNDLCMLLDVLV